MFWIDIARRLAPPLFLSAQNARFRMASPRSRKEPAHIGPALSVS